MDPLLLQNNPSLSVRRYTEAKELAKNLEKQATKVQAEAEEAGDTALKIFANLTSLPPVDTKALEVTPPSGDPDQSRPLDVPCVTDSCLVRLSRTKPGRSRRRRRTWTS